MPDSDRLRDSTADAVTNNARLANFELVEYGDDAVGVRANVHFVLRRTIAPAKAEEVEYDETMALRHERNDVAPQVAGRRKAVQEDHGIAGAASAGGVVVDPRAVEIEKLTAHASARLA